MESVQVYLTQEQRRALAAIAGHTGRTQSELIREAVDGFIVRYTEANRLELFHGTRGTWKDRDDLPDFEALRQEFDERGDATVER